MNKDIIKQIKSLPPMPDTVRQIQVICSNPSSGVADLLKVVEKDPPLTANLLKAANSPLYGFSREIITVAQAVSLFGMATVRGFAIASAVKSSFKIDLSPYGISVADFVSNSEWQSAFMMRWFSKINRGMLDILVPASFLLDIGIVVLSEHAKQMGLVKELQDRLATRCCASVDDIEKELFQMNSAEVSALLFEHWNFEEMMTNAIKHIQNPDAAPSNIRPYAYPLYIVRQLISIHSPYTPKRAELLKDTLEKAGLDEKVFLEVLPLEKKR